MIDAPLSGRHAASPYSIAKSTPRTQGRRLRICLAGSGGGHVRQLLDLAPAWGAHDSFFVSEDTALSRSIAEQHDCVFVPHFARGQARAESPLALALAGVRNFLRAAAIVLHRRPEVVVSTGAGAVFFVLVLARLAGAKVVLIESFARFERPSLFGRMAAPFAHHKIVQAPALSADWPDAAVFDPLEILDRPPPPKQPLLFATVGAVAPFDRLVTMVAELKAEGAIAEHVVIQTGKGGTRPAGVEVVESLPFEAMQTILGAADVVVCHGGTGSLVTALREGCRVIAVPRRFAIDEVYDDHQVEITGAFAARGLIAAAETKEALREALAAAHAREPVVATSNPAALIDHLNGLFAGWSAKRGAERA